MKRDIKDERDRVFVTCSVLSYRAGHKPRCVARMTRMTRDGTPTTSNTCWTGEAKRRPPDAKYSTYQLIVRSVEFQAVSGRPEPSEEFIVDQDIDG